MAAGLSKSAKYHRSYRYANRIEHLANKLGIPCKRQRGDTVQITLQAGYLMSISLQWGSLSNGESVGRVGAFLVADGLPVWRASHAEWPPYAIRQEKVLLNWYNRANKALTDTLNAHQRGELL